jgi:hypothetical protein
VTLTPHPLLVPWSRNGRAIPLLPLWAVRPVQGCILQSYMAMCLDTADSLLNIQHSVSSVYMRPCSLVDRYQWFGETSHRYCSLKNREDVIHWRWRQLVPPKRWFPSPEIHDVAAQKTIILKFSAMKSLNVIFPSCSSLL